MPLYEYLCDACGKRFDVIQKFSDGPPEACRVCGKGPVHRQASSPAIQFKGSGFYITDYAQKGRSEGAAEGAAEGKGSDATGSEAKGSDGKGATGTPAAGETKSADSTSPASTAPSAPAGSSAPKT